MTDFEAGQAEEQLLAEMLYLIARDNEGEGLIQKTAQHPAWFEVLCRCSLQSSEPEARWQFAAYLPECPCNLEVKDLILDFVRDSHEYVNRRALLAMPALRPDCVKQFAPVFWEWDCYHPELQEYQRIAVLASLDAIHSNLLPQYLEQAKQDGRARWMLTTLTDQVLGEIPHMRYIDGFDVLEEPKAEPPILMSRLPDKLKEKGLDLSTDPETYLETYIGYQMKPDEDSDADWRQDVIVGSTCCVPLVNGYLNGDNELMDDLHADGAVAGFFSYPLDTLREEERSQKIFDFRDRLIGGQMRGVYPEPGA